MDKLMIVFNGPIEYEISQLEDAVVVRIFSAGELVAKIIKPAGVPNYIIGREDVAPSSN